MMNSIPICATIWVPNKGGATCNTLYWRQRVLRAPPSDHFLGKLCRKSSKQFLQPGGQRRCVEPKDTHAHLAPQHSCEVGGVPLSPM